MIYNSVQFVDARKKKKVKRKQQTREFFQLSEIMAAAFGALAALADYSDSDMETESEDESPVFESVRSSIFNGILAGVVKEAVRRSEFAKKIRYRNRDSDEYSEGGSTASSANEAAGDSDNSSECSSDSDAVILTNSKEASKSSRKGQKFPPRVKGEMLPCDLPAIEDLQITVPEYECLEIGTILSVVDDLVVVKAGVSTAALDLDSILFLEKGQRSLGKVFDVMGPVIQPFYCVRFNSNDDIKGKNVTVGMPVFYAPRTEHTSFIFLEELMRLKGSDASWENDKEPPPSHMDYSDDEEDRKSRKKKKPEAGSADSPAQINTLPPTKQTAYVPPNRQTQTSNAFYRKAKRYNPRDFGPVQWNSMHTQHMRPQQNYGVPPPPVNYGQRPPMFGGQRPPMHAHFGAMPDFSVPPPPPPPSYN